MASLSMENVRKLSGIKAIKFSDSDTASKKSSVHNGASKPTGNRKFSMAIQQGNTSEANRASFASLLMMKRKLTQWKANRMFSWNMQQSVPVKKENTFQLEPDDKTKFCAGRVQALMEDILEDMLQNQAGYDPKICSTMSQCISDTIKAKVKCLGYHRYKFVVHVLMAQDSSQGLQVASRCVWDNERDNFASAMYKVGDLVVIANTFATYYE